MYEVCLPPEDSALKESEDEENEIKKKGVGAMVKVFHFIMKQSYICALIAMMVSRADVTYRADLCCICVTYFDVKVGLKMILTLRKRW